MKEKHEDKDKDEEMTMTAAAAYLGISDVTLRRYLKLYDIEPYTKKFKNAKFLRRLQLDRMKNS